MKILLQDFGMEAQRIKLKLILLGNIIWLITRTLNGSPSTGTCALPSPMWMNVFMPLNSWKEESLMGRGVFIFYASCTCPLLLACRWCISCFQSVGYWHVFMEANYIHCCFEPCVHRTGMLYYTAHLFHVECHVKCDVNMVSRTHHLDKYLYWYCKTKKDIFVLMLLPLHLSYVKC